MNNLPHFPSFDLETDKTNSGARWEKWIGRLENLFKGMLVGDDDQKRALLLHYAGEKVYDIYDVEKKETEETYDATKKVLGDYFSPQKNIQIEIYNFRTYKQSEEQSLDEYVTELRTLAKTCGFTDIDGEILQQVIQHGKSNQLRRRALREPDKKLDAILTMGRMLEQSDQHAKVMEKNDQNLVRKVSNYARRGRGGTTRGRTAARRGFNSQNRGNFRETGQSYQRGNYRRALPTNKYRNCGYECPHRGTPCPAKGKTCNMCSSVGHFARCCQKSKRGKVNEVSREEDLQSNSEEEFLYNITVKSVAKENKRKTPQTKVTVNEKKITATIDTGSSVNIIDERTYNYIGKPKIQRKYLPKLLPYGGGNPLPVKGYMHLSVEKNEKITVAKFYLVKGNYGVLIGYDTSCEMELVKITQNISLKTKIEDKYPGIYKGIGKLKNKTVKLHINPNVKPVAQRNRRTPFHLRDRVEKEITTFLENDIIEEVINEPTPWVSPIVTPPKQNGDVRLCVDMREANKAIERERHEMPTIDELIHDMNGAKIFSKLDLKAGYNQLVLQEESRYITTFATHMGLYRYKRLNFGTNSASEVFQKTISEVIQGIEGSKNISDDIIVYAKNQSDHDKALDKVFRAIHESGMTLNRSKCEFNKKEITFLE
ncbi:uncharacterized protein K02A2.6-like [Ruditapes philippinarum]|uniref:uncharacterized protein K02A2.6-like n=1 Tax=Ruditapes philippinarum TaxID=129788 RepID=UPI00295B5D1E|nr:uncharacterized protein K02A2.6-like [Ruditapes philippinarum]